MEFKIEKNIPIPPKGKHKRLFPFHEMEVGDSFFVPNEFIDKHYKNRKTLASSAFYHGKRHNVKLTTCKQENGFRIWRVE